MRRNRRSTSYLCKAMAMSIRSQQNQPVPSIAKPDNLKEAIINIRRREFPLHDATETCESYENASHTSIDRVWRMGTHILYSPCARCAPWVQTSGKTRQIETNDRPNAARCRVEFSKVKQNGVRQKFHYTCIIS
jgi:hypothetical protein